MSKTFTYTEGQPFTFFHDIRETLSEEEFSCLLIPFSAEIAARKAERIAEQVMEEQQ